MTYLHITIIFVLILYLFSIDWKELGRNLKAGAWFFILVYAVMGIAIFKFFTEGSGH